MVKIENEELLVESELLGKAISFPPSLNGVFNDSQENPQKELIASSLIESKVIEKDSDDDIFIARDYHHGPVDFLSTVDEVFPISTAMLPLAQYSIEQFGVAAAWFDANGLTLNEVASQLHVSLGLETAAAAVLLKNYTHENGDYAQPNLTAEMIRAEIKKR